MHLQLSRNACCCVAVIHYILHCVTAWIWHPTPNKWQEIPHATHAGCYLSLNWSRNRQNTWERETIIYQYTWCRFFFPFICTFTFGFWTVKKNEQSKEKDIHILHLIASGIFMCSQSVTFIVDIHLPLIAWLHIGGHSHKTAEWNQNQKSFCHLLYYAQIDWFLRRVLISVLNCVHV